MGSINKTSDNLSYLNEVQLRSRKLLQTKKRQTTTREARMGSQPWEKNPSWCTGVPDKLLDYWDIRKHLGITSAVWLAEWMNSVIAGTGDAGYWCEMDAVAN